MGGGGGLGAGMFRGSRPKVTHTPHKRVWRKMYIWQNTNKGNIKIKTVIAYIKLYCEIPILTQGYKKSKT